MDASNNRQTLLDRFDTYCNHTNLHGYVYLRRNNTMPIIERLVWVCIVAVNLVVSGFVLSDVWYAWINDPFVIVYDSNVKTIWEVPFPSVTVCSFVSVKRSVIDLNNVTDKRLLLFSSLVCPSSEFFDNYNLSIDEREMKSFYSFLKEVTPTCQEMIKRCEWVGKEFDCCKHFNPVITDNGLCYSFNSLPSEMLFTNCIDKNFISEHTLASDTVYWEPGEGYPPGRGHNKALFYPRWARYVGYDMGLSVEMAHIISEFQPLCSGGSFGFKAMINSPEDAPVSSKAAVRIALERDAVLHVSPMTISTPTDLQYTDISLRGCLFQGERILRHFRFYTQNHCIQECLSEAFLRHCGCVPFYSPRNHSIPVCSRLSDQECFRFVEELCNYLEVHETDVTHFIIMNKGNLVTENIRDNSGVPDGMTIPWCGCYPPCNEVTYDLELSNGVHLYKNPTLPWQKNITERTHFAKLTIFYNDRHFFGIHRETQGSFLDMLGICGGLLGLLMGFSCIACVDVLYHALIRPFGLSGRLHEPTSLDSPVRHLNQPHPYFIN